MARSRVISKQHFIGEDVNVEAVRSTADTVHLRFTAGTEAGVTFTDTPARLFDLLHNAQVDLAVLVNKTMDVDRDAEDDGPQSVDPEFEIS